MTTAARDRRPRRSRATASPCARTAPGRAAARRCRASSSSPTCAASPTTTATSRAASPREGFFTLAIDLYSREGAPDLPDMAAVFAWIQRCPIRACSATSAAAVAVPRRAARGARRSHRHHRLLPRRPVRADGGVQRAGPRRLRLLVRHAALRRAQRAEAGEPARARAAPRLSLPRPLRRRGRADPERRRRRAARDPRARRGKTLHDPRATPAPATPSSTTRVPTPIAPRPPPTPGRARSPSCARTSRLRRDARMTDTDAARARLPHAGRVGAARWRRGSRGRARRASASPVSTSACRALWLRMIEELSSGEDVQRERARRRPTRRAWRRCSPARRRVRRERVHLHRIPTNEPWCRDHGPIFVVRDGRARGGRLGLQRLGRQVPAVRPRRRRARGRSRRCSALRAFHPGIVMEGGSLDVNGRGTLLTTESCLLEPEPQPDARPRRDRAPPRRVSRRPARGLARRRHRRRRHRRPRRRHHALRRAPTRS